MAIELRQFMEFFDHAEKIGLSSAEVYLLYLIINRIYGFSLRKIPLKKTKKYFSDGTLQEIHEEYRQ